MLQRDEAKAKPVLEVDRLHLSYATTRGKADALRSFGGTADPRGTPGPGGIEATASSGSRI